MATAWRALGKCMSLMNAKKTATVTATAKEKPFKRWSGLTRKLSVSPELQDFLGGVNESSRAVATKKVWEHIKLHNLQNPNNKKEIMCDQKLKALFGGRDTVAFVEVLRLLSQHFVKTD